MQTEKTVEMQNARHKIIRLQTRLGFADEKDALRCAPLFSAFSVQFDARSVRSVFSDVHAAPENYLTFFASSGANSTRYFLKKNARHKMWRAL